MKGKNYLKELEHLITTHQYQQINQLTDEIDLTSFSKKEAEKTLKRMKKKRLYPELEKAAGLFLFTGKYTIVTKKLYAQALLDQNRVKQGKYLLEKTLNRMSESTDEYPEILGLLGRAYKQSFINYHNPSDLKRAIELYYKGWEMKKKNYGYDYDYRWHGINLVALVALAKREIIQLERDYQEEKISQQILREIKKLSEIQEWDYTTAMEACIALNKPKKAFQWVKKYISHPNVDAFNLYSTIRQLKEVWKLEDTAFGKQLIPVLNYELLQRNGGSIEVTNTFLKDESGFEALYGRENSKPIQWFNNMLNSTKSVARIVSRGGSGTRGTGFLIEGRKLYEKWGKELVFVTNAHVISKNTHESALLPSESIAEFTCLKERPQVRLGELLYSSDKSKLDVSILKINAPNGTTGLDLAKGLPFSPKAGKKAQRIYVMGHPQGEELTITFYDNELIGYENRYIRYNSPTEKGNSGSPVFNRQWDTIAIHHRAINKLRANQGVLLNAIKAGIEGEFG